jgi:uncharacterized glyoxalase superfamily protein PhnB
MTDAERPFRSLARPTTPVHPDPAFAAALRERLRRARLQLASPPVPVTGGSAVSALIPYLAVRNARAAIGWYTEALGAQVVGDPYVMDDDRIGHAELSVAGATLYLADEYLELGLAGPEDGRVSVTLHLSIPDVDTAVARAVELGATLTRPVSDAPYGRTGVILDPYGHRWMLQTPIPPPAEARPPVRQGDAVYLTLRVPDGARARDFYGAVLGWTAVPGRVPDGWQVEGTTPMVGISGASDEPGMVPMYSVDDIEAVVTAVDAAGGEAGDVERQSYGLTALCRDDQGLPFYLGQLG